MPKTKEELAEQAQLVRLFEASCKIEYPTPDESNFRIALAKKLGRAFDLKEVRGVKIDGPVTSAPARK